MVSLKVRVREGVADAFLMEVNAFLGQLETISSDCLFVTPEQSHDGSQRIYRLRAGRHETLTRCIEHLQKGGVCEPVRC